MPYILVVGAREAEEGTVSVRSREKQDVQETLALDPLVERIVGEAKMSF